MQARTSVLKRKVQKALVKPVVLCNNCGLCPVGIIIPMKDHGCCECGSQDRRGCCCLCCCSVIKSCLTLLDPWTAALQTSLSFTVSWSLLKFMPIASVMPYNNLIFCHPLLLLPSILPSIRVFSSESALHIRWPKDWSFSFSISPSNEYEVMLP